MTTETVAVDASPDWITACEVQERFMQHPGSTAPVSEALSYSARCRQVRTLGGDCYDFLPLGQNRLALVIGDASGKSLAAALLIANVQSSLRTAASFAGDDPDAVIRAVNRQLHGCSLADSYATLFYGVFDASTRTLRYVNAGHNPPLVIRQDCSIVRLQTGGLPVGIFPNATYETGVLQLRRDDLLIAFTDGVREVANLAGQEWGIDGLIGAALDTGFPAGDGGLSAQEIVESIFASFEKFSSGGQSDDATVAVVRVR
jgi:phosphoserine phosphatase RsbU/P